MMTKVLFFLLIFLFPIKEISAQGIYQGTASEGATHFLPITVLDETGVPVIPKSFSFYVVASNGSVTQAKEECCSTTSGSGCPCSSRFNGITITAASMVLILTPAANRIIGQGVEKEFRYVASYATYPSNCSTTESQVNRCKTVTGLHRYEVINRTGMCVNTSAFSNFGALQPEPCS